MERSELYKTIGQQLLATQTFFKQVSSIQSNGGVFERFNKLFPDSEDEISKLSHAFSSVEPIAKAIGSREQLETRLASDPSLMSTPYSEQDSIWEGLVKQASATRNTCNNLINTIQTLPTLINSQKDEKDIAWDVKCALCGPGGASSQGKKPKSIALDINERVNDLVKDLDPILLAISTSNLYNKATQSRMIIEGKIGSLKENVEEARRRYQSAFFGKDAKKEDYEKKKQVLDLSLETLKASELFCSELKNIDKNANAVIPALAEVSTILVELIKRLNDLEQSMNFCNLATPAQMSDKDWVFKALCMPDFETKWNDLEKQTTLLI